MMFFNIWVGIFTQNKDDYKQKINYLQELTGKMGIPLFDSTLHQSCIDYFDKVMAGNCGQY